MSQNEGWLNGESLLEKPLSLTTGAFLKENVFNIKGWSLIAARYNYQRALNEDALAIVSLLDGSKTGEGIVEVLAREQKLPSQMVRDACFSFLKELNSFGLIAFDSPAPVSVRRVAAQSSYSIDVLSLVLTSQCNLKCVYCYNDASPILAMKRLLLDEVLGIVKECGVSIVGLIGGEPMLHPDYLEIVRELTALGVYSNLYTNGTLLTAKNIEELSQAGLSKVSLSVDSVITQTYQSLVQNSVSPKRLLEKIALVKRAGMEVKTNTVLVPGVNDSEEQLEKLIEILQQLDVDTITFTEIVPQGAGRKYPPQKDIYETGVFLGKKLRNQQGQGDTSETKILFAVPDSSLPRTVCGAGIYYATIFPDGAIAPCVSMPEKSQKTIMEKSFIDIWEGDNSFSLFRNNDNTASKDCEKCTDWEECLGGCKAKAYYLYGSLNAPDLWQCGYYGHRSAMDKYFR